jgi:ATP-dependent DNA helicase RecG
MKLTDPITRLPKIGEKSAQKFNKLGVQDIAGLLFTFPRKYLDYSEVTGIAGLSHDKTKTLIAELVNFKNIYLRGKGGRTMQTARLSDGEMQLDVVWFNMPFLEGSLIIGQTYAFVAKLSTNKRTGKPQLVAPKFELHQGEDNLQTGRIVPVYALTQGLPPRQYRQAVKSVIDHFDLIEDIDRVERKISAAKQKELNKLLRKEVSEKRPWLSMKEALAEIHFPTDLDRLAAAKFRLGVEELIPIQQKLIEQRKKRRSTINPLELDNNLKVTAAEVNADYWQRFPFEPTKDQLKATEEIYKDLSADVPSYRLIQGDVGSGKTAIAGFAAYLTLLSGFDCVIMVPTTILAHQHYAQLSKVFPESTQLVTSDETVLINNSNPKLTIGTQALLHRFDDLKINLGTLIVDEEHRFGVSQRKQLLELTEKSKIVPNYLSLTATPIPRTLALSIFGEIDISVIKTKPKTQKPRITYLVPQDKRLDSIDWIAEHISKGNLVYWICPLIEAQKTVEGEETLVMIDEKKTVETTYLNVKELFARFPKVKVDKLHGKLKAETKQQRLEAFRKGEFQILVSTTVIEVGIDIPQANVMVIESADNFGLAQLHQLRGRVGRAERQGYCLLYTEQVTFSERLEFFARENDGLSLAEYDLRQRGPGEVYGQVQSGIPNLQIADITDKMQVEVSRLLATD